MYKNHFQHFVHLAFVALFVSSLTINDQLLSNTYLSSVTDQQKPHQVDISAYSNYTFINIKFSFTNQNPLSATFVMASLTDYYIATQINQSFFYGKSQKDFWGIMDLENMQVGQTQYINIMNQPNTKSLYLTVFNQDPNNTASINIRSPIISYQIQIAGSPQKICPLCKDGVYEEGTSNECQCTNCSQGFVGFYCQIKSLFLEQSIITSSQIDSPAIILFQIPQSVSQYIQITVSKQGDGAIGIYLQEIETYRQFASYLNRNSSLGQGQGSYSLLSFSQNIRISLNTNKLIKQNNSSISLSIQKYDNISTTIFIQYSTISEDNKFQTTQIIIGAIVGPLFIVIIIGLCYLYKNPTKQQIQNIKILKQTLSTAQINKYFPTSTLKTILEKYHQKQLNNCFINAQKECSRCFSLIKQDDLIKVTYCHHIFHQQCFLTIFLKTKKCPCCLKQLSKSKTLEQYQKICKQNNVADLNKIELVYQLLKNRNLSYMTVDKQLDDNIRQLNNNQIFVEDLIISDSNQINSFATIELCSIQQLK